MLGVTNDAGSLNKNPLKRLSLRLVVSCFMRHSFMLSSIKTENSYPFSLFTLCWNNKARPPAAASWSFNVCRARPAAAARAAEAARVPLPTRPLEKPNKGLLGEAKPACLSPCMHILQIYIYIYMSLRSHRRTFSGLRTNGHLCEILCMLIFPTRSSRPRLVNSPTDNCEVVTMASLYLPPTDS